MSDLLARVKQQIADNSINKQATPIVDEALGLIANTEIDFKKRLPNIYSLFEKANAAGGIEREHCRYIIESLYAAASEEEFNTIKQFEASQS